jgi:hypothetical protein
MITTIAADPVAVRSLRMADTSVRLACQHHYRGLSRPLVDAILSSSSGTAWCEDLATCLRAVPTPSDRVENAVIDRCLEAAKPRPAG